MLCNMYRELVGNLKDSQRGKVMDTAKDWLTLDELASWLDVPPISVERCVREGTLPALLIDGHLRFSKTIVLDMARRAAIPRPVPVHPLSMSRRTRGADPAGSGPS